MTNPLAGDLDFILEHSAEVWQELRGQRLFITGGTGFFGRWLLESLCWANDRLDLQLQATVLSCSPEAFAQKAPQLARHPALTWLRGDVKDFLFPAGDFPYLIHAASEGDPLQNQQFPLRQFDTIVSGTRRVLDFAASHGTRKLLFTSSGAVYGKQPPELSHIPETYCGAPDPTLVTSAYGEAKRAAEMLGTLYAAQYGFEVKIARCFAFVGPFLPLGANYAIGNFIRDALHGGPIVIRGDGTPYRSYQYAADLMVWLWTILVRGKSCRPYNVGSDEALSIQEVAERVKEIIAPEAQIQVMQKRQPGDKPQRYIPSIARINKELSLKPRYPLGLAIQLTMNWHIKYD